LLPSNTLDQNTDEQSHNGEDSTLPLTDQTKKYRKKLAQRKQKAIDLVERYGGGRFKRECPNCDYYGLFSAFGNPPRFDAQCPACSSLERHRLFRLALDRKSLIGPTDKVLHFAPEKALSADVRRRSGQYITTDYSRENVDVKLDIEAMDVDEAAYDKIVCMHVLEHVDDHKALAEIFRTLAPGGTAILATPIVEGWKDSYEDVDVSTMSKSERVLHYGQWDHVRFYGRDFRQRIKSAGFRLEEFVAVEPDVARYGLMRGETVFLAHKPKSAKPAKSTKPAVKKKSAGAS
jgi:SAM-dependent methyltransferase